MSFLKSLIYLLSQAFWLVGIFSPYVQPAKNVSRVRMWTIKNVPHQAVFVLNENDELVKVICSGAIISIHQILTTGNCAMEIKKNVDVTVRVGSDSAHKTDSEGSTHTIVDTILHPYFDQEEDDPRKHSNLAIVRVKEPMICDRCEVVELPDKDERLEINDTVIISGYGGNRDLLPVQQYEDREVGLVRSVKLVIAGQDICDLYFDDEMSDDQRCARPAPARREGPCAGDLGDPVVDQYKRLHGLVAYANSDCSPVNPVTFIETWHFRDWIEKFIAYDSPFGAEIIAATEELVLLKQNMSVLEQASPKLASAVKDLYDFLKGIERKEKYLSYTLS